MGEILEPTPPKKIADLKIRRLEGPGKTVEVGRDLVAMKLKDARLGAAVSLSGSVCLVTASARLVKGADIKDFAEKYLRERLSPLSGAAEVEVALKEPPPDLLVPDRSVRLELVPPAGGRFRGNVLLRVVAHETSEEGADLEVGQALISALVKVKQDQLTATRPIRRGDLVTAENAALGPVDTTYLPEAGYASLSEAAGLKARTYIGAGKLISPSMLERPPVVKRGDVVKLMVRAGLVVVSVSAKALRDAAVGDSIPVEIVDSRKQLQARVMEDGTLVSETR